MVFTIIAVEHWSKVGLNILQNDPLRGARLGTSEKACQQLW